MEQNDIDAKIFRFIAEHERIPQDQINAETTLFGDLRIDGGDADDFFRDFSERFCVNLNGLNLSQHFGSEGMNWLAVFTSISCLFRRGTPEEKAGVIPITIGDLVNAAQRGKWMKR